MTLKNETILDTLDPELMARVVSRRDALGGLSKTTIAMAAMASAPIALSMMAKKAFAQGLPAGIVNVLNFALTLEYLEDEFYKAALALPTLIPATTRPVFMQVSKHETAHVNYLKSALGAAAVAKPTFDFTAGGTFADVFTNYQTFLAVSQGFEDTGVRAYKGRAAELKSDNGILTVALQIHSVEARHAAKIRRLRGQKGWITGNTTDVPALAAVYAGDEVTLQGPVQTANFVSATAASEAFDEPLTAAQVLAIVDPFIL